TVLQCGRAVERRLDLRVDDFDAVCFDCIDHCTVSIAIAMSSGSQGHDASNAPRSHSIAPASTLMTSKRQGGCCARCVRKCRAAKMMRRCLKWLTLAAAPPNARLARWRTSTKT